MRKNSSFSPKDRRPGPADGFKKSAKSDKRGDAPRKFGKPERKGDRDEPGFKREKRDFDGGGRRDADSRGDKPKRFDSDRRERPSGERNERRERSAGKAYDKPKRFDGDKRERPSGERNERRETGARGDYEKTKRFDRDKREGSFGDRAERPERGGKPGYDKPKRFDRDKRDGSFGDHSEKPNRFERDSKSGRSFGDRGGRPGGEPKTGYERRKAFENRNDQPGEDRSEKPQRAFGKRDETGQKDSGGAGRKDYTDRKKDGGKFAKRPKGDYKEPRAEKSADSAREDKSPGRPVKPADSRPFRLREKSAPGIKKGQKIAAEINSAVTDEEPKQKTFSDIVKNAFSEKLAKTKVAEEDDHAKREQFEDKVYGELEDATAEIKPKKPYELKKNEGGPKKMEQGSTKGRKKKYKEEDEDNDEDDGPLKEGGDGEMPLNKYIAHSGESGRREAAEMVKSGKVKVNGELVLEPGYRVKHDDKVTLSGKKLTPQKGLTYILLNKPKGYITTNDDPQGRRTVMDLVTNTGADRLFPVGRLDRDTTGLLLITNDGALTQKLSHPSYKVKKVYHVTLDKPLTKADFEKIVAGVELEDGQAIVDEIAYLEKKNELGLEIHSGRNRIVRRIFESLGYVVDKLDRMMYAGLTKKNLPRGKWRRLEQREIVLLKHFKS